MKIPIGKIAGWIGRALLTAVVDQAATRLARPRRQDEPSPPSQENIDG